MPRAASRCRRYSAAADVDTSATPPADAATPAKDVGRDDAVYAIA